MSKTPSRGVAISGYVPAFAEGAKVYGANIASGSVTSANLAGGMSALVASASVTLQKIANANVRYLKLKAAIVSGTIISANVAYAVTHSLGGVPALAIIQPRYAVNEAKNFTSGAVVGLANASAMTSTKVYVIGSKGGLKYNAFILL